MNKRIYLDYAASTPVDDRVLKEMEPYWNGLNGDMALWANAISVHSDGRGARGIIEDARGRIAKLISSKKEEVIFTSGGTEGNNLAIFGVVDYLLYKENEKLSDLHLIVSDIEHPSVRDCFKILEERGASVTYIGVDKEGIIDVDDLEKNIRDNTVLVSVAYANSEIGTIQPISQIANVIKKIKGKRKLPIYFHTDASQAGLFLNCNTGSLGVDLMTIDAHKLYGPKGIGFLYKKNDVKFSPVFCGGSQEMSVRPGTVATPLVVGLGKAFEIAVSEQERDVDKVRELRDYFVNSINENVTGVVTNGSMKKRLPNNVNISIPVIDAEFFVIVLDQNNISCSSRSACLGQKDGGSYVIRAMGKSDAEANSSLRFTLGKGTTKEELDRVVKVLQIEVEKHLS